MSASSSTTEKRASHVVIFKTDLEGQLTSINKLIMFTFNHHPKNFWTDKALYLLWEPTFNINFELLRKRFGKLLKI